MRVVKTAAALCRNYVQLALATHTKNDVETAAGCAKEPEAMQAFLDRLDDARVAQCALVKILEEARAQGAGRPQSHRASKFDA